MALVVMASEFTFGIEAIHHSLNHVELVLNGKVDEVSVDNDLVWGTKRLVMAEKERRRSFRPTEQPSIRVPI